MKMKRFQFHFSLTVDQFFDWIYAYVFLIHLNLLYLQLKKTILTFQFFIFIKENEKKSNWIVVSNLGFPQDYKTRLYVFTIVNLLYLQNFIFFSFFIKEIFCFPCILRFFLCLFFFLFSKNVKNIFFFI